MAKTHLDDRESYVHESTCQEVEKDKTYFGDVNVPDDKYQQTPHKRLTTPDSTHLKAGEYETYQVRDRLQEGRAKDSTTGRYISYDA